jgi:hypothetical protein
MTNLAGVNVQGEALSLCQGWVILLVFLLLNEAACVTILILSWEQEVQMGGFSYPLSLSRAGVSFNLSFCGFTFKKCGLILRRIA